MARNRRENNTNHYLNQLSAAINIVPYIDVMLVLLVIFMVTAPLLNQGLKVNLPKTKGQSISSNAPPIIITVTANGKYYLNISKKPQQAISPQNIMSTVAKKLGKNATTKTLYIKGDRAVAYGKVMQAVLLLQRAGAQHIGLITSGKR